MAKQQKFGIKYPFKNDNRENVYMDVNETYAESIKSQIIHVIFTPKGSKLRDPNFGTNLIDYIFGPKDEETFSVIKNDITSQVGKYVPAAKFRDITIYSGSEEGDGDNGIIVSISYSVQTGNKVEDTTVAIKL